MKTLGAKRILGKFDFMRKIVKDDAMEFLKTLEMAYFQKGDQILYNKDNETRIVFLKKGSVKIVESSSGMVKHLLHEMNLFGSLSVDEDTHNEHSVCLEDVVVCFLSLNEMTLAMKKYPSLKSHIIKMQSLHIKKLEKRLSDLSYKTSEDRVFEFIFSYVKEYGKKEDNAYSVQNNLTHQDIANLTNSSRQTVNNVISSLRKKGVLEYSRTHISIPV